MGREGKRERHSTYRDLEMGEKMGYSGIRKTKEQGVHKAPGMRGGRGDGHVC